MNIRSSSALLLSAALGLSSAKARAEPKRAEPARAEPTRAEPKDSAVAQALFDQAKRLLADGHANQACPKLEESERLEPRSGTLINLANCYEQIGRLASAWSAYIESAALAKASGNADRETVARQRAAALAPRISKLTITVPNALLGSSDLEITRDGTVVRAAQWGLALPIDPGEHLVSAKAPGYAPFQTKVIVTGDAQNLSVTVLDGAALPEPSSGDGRGLGTERVLAFTAGGVGVVALGIGTAFALSSKSHHDEADQYCNGKACWDPRAIDADQAATRDGNVATALMVIGGVGLAAGVALFLMAPKASEAPSAQVGLGLGTVQVKGTF